ncbi:MAG TPA: tetratricopeptide repeat protein [Dehalococcoidia bacterium]|nr:tetratricopeptide repeat protein [Dehalococcoidia bacterium]
MPFPSKAKPPERRPGIVRRQRLVERLTEAAQRRIAIVSAPAGYGKTTLLKDFVQETDYPACWYWIDERDKDLNTFLRYILASGRNVFPEFGEHLAEVLTAGGPKTPEEASELLTEASMDPQVEYLIILDDFHSLDDAPEETRKAIEGWLYRIPLNCHVILAGRTRPQIGVLPMMTVRQEVMTIQLSDFAFTADEVVQLLREVLGREISLDDAQRLANVTEGWAGALVLLADRVESAGAVDLEKLRSSDTLFQYISLEQFDRLPEELRDFARRSGVLRSMKVTQVNELLEIENAQDLLTRLANLNLVVSEDDGTGERLYRYHGLFRAFLVSHLRAGNESLFREVNILAGQLMEGAERWEDAVYHYIQAEAWDNVVEVTEDVGWRMFEEGKWDTLAEWLEAVPAEEMTSLPRLMLWKGRMLHYLNQHDRALSLISKAITIFEENADWVWLGEALVTRGMSLRVKGDYAESRDALLRGRELLVEHNAPEMAITEARKQVGMTLSRSGDLKESAAELSAVVDIYESEGDTYNIAHTSGELGAVLGLMGRLPEGAGYLERARQLWAKQENNHMLGQTLVNLGTIYYLQGDFERASEIYEEGLKSARLVHNVQREVYLSMSIADIERDSGRYDDALARYNEALEDAWSVADAYSVVYILDGIANTHRMKGDLVQAESWAGRATAEAEKTGGDLEQGICLVTQGLIKRGQGELKEAADLLERAVSLLRDKDAGRELTLAYFHGASIYFSLKRKRLALDYLEEAAKLVKDLGYDHFLLVEAARNPLLVQYGAANKAGGGYYVRLKRLVKGVGGESAEGGEGEESESSEGETLQAYGFGHARVEYNGNEISDLEWRSEKSRELFFFFLSQRRGLRKEEIVAALWPDMPEDKTTSAFHSNMYRLRKALYQDVIAKESGRYGLDPNMTINFDVEQFQKALEAESAAGKGSQEAIGHMERAVELYKGSFAADLYSEWAESLRWQLEEQYTGLLGRLSSAYSDAGEYKKSADVCQKIIELDEFNEAAWYRLMSSYILSGQAEAAKFCYNRYVQINSEDREVDDEIPDFDEIVKELSAKQVSSG